MTDSSCENCGHDREEHVSLDHRDPTFCRVEECACDCFEPLEEEAVS